MPKALKIIAIGVAALLVLLAVAAFAISLWFDPNDYKDEITAAVESRTGRALALEGDLSLSYFPWLGVEAGKATLSNAPGFGAEPFATFDHANVSVRLAPLLQRRIEAGTIRLDGLRVNLVRNGEGRGNWEDLLAADTAAAPDEPAAPPTRVAVAGLQLRDAGVSWRDEQAQQHYVIEQISLDTGALEPGEPADVALSLVVAQGLDGYIADLKLEGTARADLEQSRYGVEDFQLDYALQDTEKKPLASGSLSGKLSADVGQSIYDFDAAELQTTIPPAEEGAQPIDVTARWATARLDQTTQQLAINELALQALDVDVTVPKVEGTNVIDAPRLSGVLDVAQLSLANVLTALAIELPAGMDATALGTASLHTDFVLEPSKTSLQLPNLSAKALGMNVQGNVRSESGKLSGNLRIPPFATAPLFKALAGTLPESIDVKPIDKLAVETTFDLDTAKKALALRDLKADLLGTTLFADVRAADFGGKAPRYTGSLRVDKLAPGQFVAVFGKLLPEGIDAKELGAVALDTRFDMKSAQDTLQLENLKTTLVGLDFSGALTLSKLSGATEYNGTLNVARFSPRALLKRFGAEVPVTADPKVLGAVEGKARVVATPALGRFEDLDLTLDQSHITGSFAVKDFANPAYEFALVIDAVDVDRYLPPPPPEPKAEERKAANAETGDVEIPVDALKALRLDGKVSADTMKIGGIKLANLKATLAARDGLARLDPLSANLYKGRFTGGMTADARGAMPAMTIKGKATDIGVGPFLKDYSKEAPVLTGLGSFNLDLTGQGDTYGKNLASANGTVGFSLKDGALAGFDVAYTLCTAYNTLARLPKPTAKDRKKTAFETISGTATVKTGIASTNDLAGATTFMKIAGKGTVDLPKQALDYDMDATLSASTKLAGCKEMDKLIGESFPLDIGGTLTEPKVMPDFGKLAKEVVKRKLEDEITERLLEKLGGEKTEEKKP